MDGEWRCVHCNKKLGAVRSGRVHIRFSRGHEYLVGFPATSVCRSCKTLNELKSVEDMEAKSTNGVELGR